MDHNWDDLRVFLAVARDETLSAANAMARRYLQNRPLGMH